MVRCDKIKGLLYYRFFWIRGYVGIGKLIFMKFVLFYE